MIKRVTIGDLRVTFTCARITKVIGVNSNLEDGSHILMWDFDDVDLGAMKYALKVVQTRYCLSDIYILETKPKTNYIAYCFTSVDWRLCIAIIAQTDFVDLNFFKYGVYRGHFTLRVTAKNGRIPKFITRLEGYELANCEVPDLKSWVKYETVRR